TYVGELGWELYVEPGTAGQVWDRLIGAGSAFGITPGGYRVLDSLRMEKGYRYYGTDMGLLDNPFEAGLGFCVRREKWSFLSAEITRRLRTLAVGGQEYVPIYGGEAVLSGGRVVTIAPQSGGLTNENDLVECEGRRYVMRLPGKSTELLAIDRANEVYNTKSAATTGIGPKVLEHVAGVDVMVLEFIPGPTMSAKTLQSNRMAARMAQSFHRLHAAPRFLQDFNMFRLIEHYLHIVDEHQVAIPDDYRDWLPTVAEIERAVEVHALPRVPCHNDLLCENFIDDGAS